MHNEPAFRPTRRSFLHKGTLLLAATSMATQPAGLLLANEARGRVRVGIITDLHYADKPSAGSRHYRETLGKIAEAGEQFRKDKPDFIAELGDLIDAADSVDVEKQYLARINKEIAALPGDKHYVLGN